MAVIRSPYAGIITEGISMPFDQIISIMRQRRSQDAFLLQSMIAIRDRYNGDVAIPLTDVKGFPVMSPPVARLITEAVDHTAMAANSTLPHLWCPALDPTSARSRKKAETRTKALRAGWYNSQLLLKLYRSYRHLCGYGTNCFLVMPDDNEQRAKIEIRDPLSAYPELRMPDDIRDPKNVGFIFGRSVDWIRRNYPEAEAWVHNAAGRNWDTLWDIVEWIDEYEIVIGIMGPRMPAYAPQDARPYGYTSYELRRWRNKAGMVPAVIPRRVTLDQIQGQLTALVGMIDLHGRLTALDIVAAEKAIFPDMVIISKNGAPPILASGQWQDGRTGKPNLISDATVQVLSKSPGPLTQPILDNLERAIRSTGNVQDMYGGNVQQGGPRTGRAMDMLGSYSTQPRVQELQTLMSKGLSVVSEAFLEVEKGYFPDKKFYVFSGLPGDMEGISYVPSEDFDWSVNEVTYPFPGMDMSQQTVSIEQMVGGELASKKWGRIMHPMISNPEAMEEEINEEALSEAARAGLLARAQQDPTALPVIARVIDLMQHGQPLVQAMQKALAEEQKAQADMQAQQQQAMTPSPGTPGSQAPSSPSGTPGTSGPAPGGNPSQGGQPQGEEAMRAAMGAPSAQGAQAGYNPIGPPANSLQDFRHLVQALNENTSPNAV